MLSGIATNPYAGKDQHRRSGRKWRGKTTASLLLEGGTQHTRAIPWVPAPFVSKKRCVLLSQWQAAPSGQVQGEVRCGQIPQAAGQHNVLQAHLATNHDQSPIDCRLKLVVGC